MQEKVEIVTNHIVHFWTILDKNTQKRILCMEERLLLFHFKLLHTSIWKKKESVQINHSILYSINHDLLSHTLLETA